MVQLLSRNVYWNKSLHFREPFATVNHGDINEQYTVKKKKKDVSRMNKELAINSCISQSFTFPPRE